MSPSGNRTSRRVLLTLLPILLTMPFGLVHSQDKAPDSVRVQGVPAGRAAVPAQKSDTVYHPTKSPGTAMLLSAVLPGAGQFYNESYWKVPIVVGFGVYLAYNWVDNNKLYKQYRDQYKQTVEAGQPNSQLLNNREFYKDQRDSFTWYLLIWYFVTLADAYVDASLYDFDVSGNLSIQTLPVLSPVPVRAMQLNLHIGF